MADPSTRKLVSESCRTRLRTPIAVITVCLCLVESTGCTINPCKRSPNGPASIEDVPQVSATDPFFLPAYAEREQVNPSAVALMRLLEPSFADERNRELTAYRCVTSTGTLAVRAVHTTEGMIIVVKTRAQRQRDGWFSSRIALGSHRQWKELEARVKEAGLWEHPPQRRTRIDGVDGEFWTLEGLRKSRHAIVSKWSPREGDPIRPPCLYLFALAHHTVQ